MVSGLEIPADPDEPIREIRVESLEDYQAVVDGWIEPVDVPALGVTVYVNEEGLLRSLPFNNRAAFLWWFHVPEVRHRAMLVGSALVVGAPNRAGENTDIPTDVARTLTRVGTWSVEVKSVDDNAWHPVAGAYTGYFEALVWAMVVLERWPSASDVRVIPVDPDAPPGVTAIPRAAA